MSDENDILARAFAQLSQGQEVAAPSLLDQLYMPNYAPTMLGGEPGASFADMGSAAASAALDFTPVIGDAKSGVDAFQAFKRGELASAALAALGALPLIGTVGDVAKGASKLGKAAANALKIEDIGSDVASITKRLDAGDVPEGWFLHGRNNSTELDPTWPIQMSRRWDEAQRYGHDGSTWVIAPNENAKLLDFRHGQTPDIEDLIRRVQADIENGDFPAMSSLDPDKLPSRSDLVDAFAPRNIIDSAGAYDSPEWWEDALMSRYYPDQDLFVLTPDGAVFLGDPSSSIKTIRVK